MTWRMYIFKFLTIFLTSSQKNVLKLLPIDDFNILNQKFLNAVKSRKVFQENGCSCNNIMKVLVPFHVTSATEINDCTFWTFSSLGRELGRQFVTHFANPFGSFLDFISHYRTTFMQRNWKLNIIQ